MHNRCWYAAFLLSSHFVLFSLLPIFSMEALSYSTHVTWTGQELLLD